MADKIRIGFAQDPTGNATEKLLIVAETTDERYVCRHFTVTQDLYGRVYLVSSELQLRNKEDIKDIREMDRLLTQDSFVPPAGHIHENGW